MANLKEELLTTIMNKVHDEDTDTLKVSNINGDLEIAKGNVDGNSIVDYKFPLPIPEKTDIWVEALSTVADSGMNATFTIQLIDNV